MILQILILAVLIVIAALLGIAIRKITAFRFPEFPEFPEFPKFPEFPELRIPEQQKIEFPQFPEFPEIRMPEIPQPLTQAQLASELQKIIDKLDHLIPEPQKIEFPKFPDFPEIKIPDPPEPLSYAELQNVTEPLLRAIEKLGEQLSEKLDAVQAQTQTVQTQAQTEALDYSGFTQKVEEAASLMRINQSELGAALDAWNKSVAELLNKLTGTDQNKEQEAAFIDELRETLRTYQESTNQALLESAMRTQEILLEVLEKKEA
jgi:hypothetical protein